IQMKDGFLLGLQHVGNVHGTCWSHGHSSYSVKNKVCGSSLAYKDAEGFYCYSYGVKQILGLYIAQSGMDKEKAKDYILNCQSYDGGFGVVPGAESHGELDKSFCYYLKMGLYEHSN
ncbi:hypothetical protein S83_047282, partial [Arachis hypogaea]